MEQTNEGKGEERGMSSSPPSSFCLTCQMHRHRQHFGCDQRRNGKKIFATLIVRFQCERIDRELSVICVHARPTTNLLRLLFFGCQPKRRRRRNDLSMSPFRLSPIKERERTTSISPLEDILIFNHREESLLSAQEHRLPSLDSIDAGRSNSSVHLQRAKTTPTIGNLSR